MSAHVKNYCGSASNESDAANDYVVQVFPGDGDEDTCAVGFLLEDHSGLAQTIHEPDTIDLVAKRMMQIANEIRGNQLLKRGAVDNVVRDVQWGSHDPSTDL